jgi:hypothetical protein
MVPLSILLGAGSVAVIWWSMPTCDQKVAEATLKYKEEYKEEQQKIAEMIAALKVDNTKLRGEINREMDKHVDYVECKHDPDVMRQVDKALAPR